MLLAQNQNPRDTAPLKPKPKQWQRSFTSKVFNTTNKNLEQISTRDKP